MQESKKISKLETGTRRYLDQQKGSKERNRHCQSKERHRDSESKERNSRDRDVRDSRERDSHSRDRNGQSSQGDMGPPATSRSTPRRSVDPDAGDRDPKRRRGEDKEKEKEKSPVLDRSEF